MDARRHNKSMEAPRYTAVVSDLHLCEAEPVHPRFPLWKKFKTAQFFFDDVFIRFLKHLEEKAKGEKIELVLNGDIFDFDSVMSMPESPVFRIEWIEKKRGLYPRPERSLFKIQVILKDHHVFVEGLKEFIQRGHNVIFVIGNHDLELHYEGVQEEILRALAPSGAHRAQIRFVEWFYISHQDTVIEHGNQYDPYCVCEDPINPFVQGYNFKSIRLPFGNLACRYILNGMGFFNPHVDSNYIMSLSEYVRFFLKYMLKAQPTLMLDWLFGAVTTLYASLEQRLQKPIREPLQLEEKVDQIAQKSNATPRMVRELRELFVDSASSNPFLMARELWLDRAFLIFVIFAVILQGMLIIKQFWELSFFWAFIPLFMLLPFFLFYSKSVVSRVSLYKEPDERILASVAAITGTQRVIYGHTHRIRHEMIGPVEHLNSGCWSPAFLDVECTQAYDQKTFIWIEPTSEGFRKAHLLMFEGDRSREAIPSGGRQSHDVASRATAS